MDVERKLADTLFAVAKELFQRGFVKDAVAWRTPQGYLRGAIVTDPFKLQRIVERHAEGGGVLPFGGRYAASVLKRMGFDGGTFEYERELVLPDFLERLSSELYDMIGEEDLRLTVIPEPGYPWPTAGDTFVSAKNRKPHRSPRPEWLLPDNIVDASRDVNSPGVNLCRFIPEVPSKARSGALTMRWGNGADDVAIVTHSFGFERGDPLAQARRIADCGGLLLPSLAVGPVPASAFGPATLVCDVGVVLRSLKPSRPRGEQGYVDLYAGDAWTAGVSEVFGSGAVGAFEQLHGHEDWIYASHVWSTGAPVAGELAGGHSDVPLIETETALMRGLKQLAAAWSRTPTRAGLKARERAVAGTGATKLSNPYFEAKGNFLFPMSVFPLCAVGEDNFERAQEFLKVAGFDGHVIPVPAQYYAPGGDAHPDVESLEYAWALADAIRAGAEQLGVAGEIR